MKPLALAALVAAAAPLAALADASYSRARIEPAPYVRVDPALPVVRVEPAPPIVRDDLRACLDRRDSYNVRMAFYDREKAATDLEGDAIRREGAQLAVQLRNLDNRDAAAVAAYNARSDAHNARVAAYNSHVAEMTSAASLLNADAADMSAYCNVRRYALSLR